MTTKVCVAVLSGLLEKLRLFYEKVPMFADYFKTCSCCCVWRLGALVHGGPDAGMGLSACVISPAGRCAAEAVEPQEVGFGCRGHAKSSGCEVPPLRGASRLAVTHTSVTEPTPSLPETSFSLPVTGGHRDNNTEQLDN